MKRSVFDFGLAGRPSQAQIIDILARHGVFDQVLANLKRKYPHLRLKR